MSLSLGLGLSSSKFSGMLVWMVLGLQVSVSRTTGLASPLQQAADGMWHAQRGALTPN